MDLPVAEGAFNMGDRGKYVSEASQSSACRVIYEEIGIAVYSEMVADRRKVSPVAQCDSLAPLGPKTLSRPREGILGGVYGLGPFGEDRLKRYRRILTPGDSIARCRTVHRRRTRDSSTARRCPDRGL